MPCMGNSNTCLMGAGSDHWRTKLTEEETFPPAVPLLKAWSAIWIVVTILYGFTRVAVWLGLSGVCRDPAKWEYDSSGVLCMWVGWNMGVRGGGLEG